MKALHADEPARQRRALEDSLYKAVLTLKTADECRKFFADLATPAELEALADRWAVVELLERGIPYREIHERTGVSVTTVGRVARFLTAGNGGYQLASQRLRRRRGGRAQA
ncbi:MAG: TrpR, YerC/YecD [Gammaproteobacteria bacterium]|nr:TrpR, YerC/YecD [Gammaproteobacteria bacterium]